MIAKLDELRKSLSYAVREPARWTGLLARNLFAKAIRGSNSIEGYDVSEDDAIAAAAGEEPLDEKTESWMALWGYRQAMTYVIRLADDPHFAYSTDLIRSLHYMMLSYDLSKLPGQWRPGAIAVRDDEKDQVVYEGPDAELIPDLMQELVRSLEGRSESTPRLVLAAMAHLNLVMIHPFKDGNGRMARCLQTLVLARSRILAPVFSSIEEYLGRVDNRRPYYDILAAIGGGSWHPERDSLEWVRFNLRAHHRQAMNVRAQWREMRNLWDALEKLVTAERLPERVVFALADAAHGLRVRNSTYRTAAEISKPMASRDLSALAKLGLLVAKGERRGRYYLASPIIKEAFGRTREKRTESDPYRELSQPSPFPPDSVRG